ncbi:MAG: protein translocase subunit SecDF, partial [Verrucomicrobiae bacterium]|nr:protein translocase subunit SecDF [Verrucomicrobiae bacterium]
MNGSTIWKLVLSALVVLVAILYLVPFKDTPFKEFVVAKSNHDQAFLTLVDEAEGAATNGEYPTFYVALREIAKGRTIDLSAYFPELTLESSLRSAEKRNQVLLDYLLKESKARLQPGLDLKGGVVFVFELDQQDSATEYQRQSDL